MITAAVRAVQARHSRSCSRPGGDAGPLEGEERSRASAAGLDTVHDQDDLVTVAESPAGHSSAGTRCDPSRRRTTNARTIDQGEPLGSRLTHGPLTPGPQGTLGLPLVAWRHRFEEER